MENKKKLREVEERQRIAAKNRRIKAKSQTEWYNLRPILGFSWAYFYILIGARERGKSYSVMDFCLNQWRKKGKPFYWMKLSEASTRKMLSNNAAKFVDADLYRKYGLKLSVKGTDVYDNGERMATMLALSTAYNDKGVALYDSEDLRGKNIVIDEFQLEKDQKRTFDVCYNLVVQLENLCRSSKNNIKIFMIGNTTEEASDILSMFNFLPEKFGIFKLKKRKCVIHYMDNSQAYIERRKDAVANILAGNQSNFTNKIDIDTTHIYKGRLMKPQYIVKFSKDETDWFTCWEGNVLAKYNGEFKGAKDVNKSFAMRRYIDDRFNPEFVSAMFEMYDTRAFKFRNLITQKQFGYQLSLIKRK